MNNLRDSPIDGKFALLEHTSTIGLFSASRVKKGLYRGEIPLLTTQSHLVNVNQAARPVMALHPRIAKFKLAATVSKGKYQTPLAATVPQKMNSKQSTVTTLGELNIPENV